MKITSSAFQESDMIPKKYTCEGEDISPPLQIAEPPAAVKSFCLIVHDHDAPGGDFVHWLIWDIDPKSREISEGTTPVGSVEGTNDFGRTGYGGPCPPTGKHRYEFHLYALNAMIDLPAGSDKIYLRKRIEGSILEEASLIGLYQKNA